MKKMLAVMLAFMMSVGLAGVACAENYDTMNPPIVTVEGGQLRGLIDGNTFEFLGVQYAQAERFKMPEKVPAWEGIKGAQAYGPNSPIPEQTTVGTDEPIWPHSYWIQNENCQYLNVWTPSIDTTAKKPVMVFFHGGGFTNGSAIEGQAYNGKNLSEYGDVVVVTVNHRLNVLGFLDLSKYGDEYANSKNLSMADLVASLQWVHDNIASFGGDPGNVLIFGQSGGGMKVNTLMHMPSAEGLFNKAIIMSGVFNATSNTVSASTELSQQVTEKTLANLKLDGTKIDELSAVPYQDLLAANQAANTELNAGWSPTADGSFILADYCDWSKSIPVIYSSTFAEFNGYELISPTDMGMSSWTDEQVQAKITEKFGSDADAAKADFAKLFPEKNIVEVCYYNPLVHEACTACALDRATKADAPTYVDLFTLDAHVNGGLPPIHCYDLLYAFHNVDLLPQASGATDDAHACQDAIASAYVAFAKTGDPSTDSLKWSPYTAAGMETMIFNGKSTCESFDGTALATIINKVTKSPFGN